MKKAFPKIDSWRAQLLLLPLLLVLLTTISYGQIALRGSATTAISTSASITINTPTGVVAGDIMIANISNYFNGTNTSASLTGWTEIAGTNLDRGRATLLYKIAGASEPTSYTFSVTASSSAVSGAIIAFSGVCNTTPFDVTAATSWYTATSTTLSAIPSITTASANAAVLMFGNCARVTSSTNANFTNAGWTLTSPSPLTELYDVGHNAANNSTCVGAAWALKTTAGATGAGGLNCNINTNPRILAGITIALRPAPIVNAGAALTAICRGGTSAGLGGSVGGSATGGTWSDGGVGGSFSPSATTLNATYTPPSTYTGIVTLTLTSSGGSCGTVTASKTLSVGISFLASTTTPNICSGSTAALTGAATGPSNVTAAFQGFESSGSTVTYAVTGGATKSGTSAAADLPASTSFVNSGTTSYWINSGTATITTANITGLTNYSSKKVSLDLASFSIGTTANGADATDVVTVAISLDGGTTYSNELSVNGGATGNAVWSFTSGTGVASVTYDGNNTPTSFAPSGGGARTTDGFSILEVNLPNSATQVRIRVTMVNNSTSEGWVIDDIALTGLNASFAWTSLPSGFTSDLQNISVTPTENTVYTAIVTIVAGCTATDTVAVNVAQPNAATISYAGTPFCSTLTSGVVTRTGTAGGTYSSAAGLSINSSTGEINPSLSTAGTYTVTYTMPASGACSAAAATTSVTINAAASATINYAGSPFCRTVTAAQAVTRTGTAGGTFTSTAGLTINASTGAITPSTSTAGTYTVTYTVTPGGCTTFTTTTSVTITALPAATISYAGTPFCSSDANAEPVTLTGTTGGTFSSTAGLSINSSTGEITPSTSTAGTYTVTYTMAAANGCAAQTATTSVIINAEASATISYASAAFCRSVTTGQAVTRTGTAGGTYTASPAGLTINASTGAITPSTSTAGTYTVTYAVTPGGCSTFSTTTTVTINALPTAVTVTGGGTVCDQTILTASGGIGGTIYYQSTLNGGTSTTTESSSQTISTSGTYYFNAVTSEGCWGTQGSATVTVNVSPTTTGVTICAGGNGELTATSVCNSLTGQTSGPRDATSGTNVTGVGTLAWTNPGNIAGTGTAGMQVNTSVTTNYLRGTAYGFAIPSNATINGITLSIRKSSSGTVAPYLRDSEVKLVKGGVILAANKAATTTDWSNNNVLATTTYGGAADLWNTTWTPAEINASNFGAVLAATNASTANNRTAAVDFMQITVTFSIPGSINWYTASSGGTLLGSGTTFNPVGVSGSGLANTNTLGTTTFYAECSTGSTCRRATDFIISNDANPKGKLSISDTTLCSPNAINISVADTGLYSSGYPAGTTVEWLGYGISGPIGTTTISSNSGSTFQAQITLGGTGCVGLSNTITVTTRSIAMMSTITPASCSQNNGKIKVIAVSPVAPPYRFIWKDASNTIIRDFVTNEISDSIMNLEAGNYRLDVYDNNGGTISCQSTTFTYTVETAPAPVLNISGTNNSCNGVSDGTASVAVTGSAPFTYLWNAGSSSTTNSIFGLSPGTYIVTVTDTYGCTSMGAVTISTPTLIAGNGVVSSSCSNINNGSIVLSVTGGSGNKVVEWYDGNSNWMTSGVNSISNLASGTYYALITDANNCQTTEEYYVGSITIATTELTASACDSYSLPWGQTATTTGTYSHTYTSYQGCDSIVNYTVTITPSTSNTTSVNSCGEYTWSVNNTTYTASGTYSVISGCHTETLNLTYTPIPSMPSLACYETANFNTSTCVWDVTGSQPQQPTLACYETASFNTTSCTWDVTGTQPAAPTGLACYETATFNSTSCVWDVTGSQPAMPTLACYETASFNTTSCTWDVTGTQPAAPTGLACYETSTFNSTSCVWDVTGSQPAMPTLACYETASFNTTSCTWDVTGTQPAAPTGLACYETATFNTTSCAWDVTGSQPAMPTLACYETTTFNTTSCTWDVTGTQPATPTVACYETATFNTTSCLWDVTGTQPAAPSVACYETATFNSTSCQWDVTGTQPAAPSVACYETATFNSTSCQWDVTGTQPAAPTGLACYETATFNTTSCAWDVTGSQPAMPTLACYETASFNTTSCAWDVTGTQPAAPTGLACYETANFNTTSCAWDVTGSQPAMPTLACYETANFNTTSCAWDVTGSQPSMPTLACYETATFNSTSCQWDVTGTQPAAPSVACYETANFNSSTCNWDVTGTQPSAPSVACYETATFNSTSCQWDVTGTQPAAPSIACYETANFNSSTCNWDVTGTQPAAPSVACYETANFNSSTCNWDVTGTQPAAPLVACYETANFNSSTCNWDVTGTQPAAPSVACYETATFNSTSCQWDVTGTQPAAPSVACYETANFNSSTCNWDVTGTQPAAPSVACYETANFNSSTCNWDVTGSQPAAPSVACYETATFNSTSCQWDVTGTQPAAPSVACYETASFNSTSCQWDVTGSQPAAPSVACYETATFNSTSCQWDVTGTQPAAPSGLACYETATFDNNECEWEIEGDQPIAPTGLACYETSTFNSTTCQWDVTGSPAAAIVTTTSVCDTYTWSANSQVYTQSGTYSFNANCQDYTLNLTINNTQTYYADADSDGFGNTAITTTSCTGTPAGFVSNSSDCDDNSSTVYPGATEICSNNIDDDCDGQTDENCVCTNPPTANAGNDLSACQGQPVTLNGSIGGGATSATWTTSGTGTFSNANALNATYTPSAADATSGSVTLTLTTNANQPCTAATSQIAVNVTAIPANAGTITGQTNVCKPLSNIFTYSIAPVAGAASYTWTVPAGVVIQGSATGNSISVKFIDAYVQPGLNGQICVTANNSNGCFSSQASCLTISVNVSAPGQPASIAGPYTACPGDSGTYSIPVVARSSAYNWTIPNNTTLVSSNANSIRIAYGQAFTSGPITVNVSNSCGVGNTRIRNIVPTILAAPDSIYGQRDSMCTVTNTRTYTINKVPGALSYAWTVPAGTSIVGASNDTSIVVDFAGGVFTYGKITAAGVNVCGVGRAKIAYLNSFEYTDSACIQYTLPWNTVVTASGDYSYVYSGSTGCDSTVIAHITIFMPTSSEFTATGCDSYLLPWSTTVTSSGDYTHTYLTTKGCDSVVTAHITIVNSTSNTTVASVCGSYTWSVNGTTYTQSGNYSSVTGCHTEILQLTITPFTTQTASASACDSYTWSVDGNTYTQSGSYSAVVGCVTKVLNLTITNSTSNTTNVNSCDSYLWSANSTTYTQSGTYSSVNGCHTEIINLTITPSSTVNNAITACDSYTWSANSNTYTQSGNYTSVSGCVTTILNLTIIPATSNFSASVCDSYTWNINGSTYTQSGVYSAVTGCHTDILTLTITNSTSNTTAIIVCDSYTWSVNGQTYTQSGTYSSVNGCHTEILNASINPTITYYADADGDGYGISSSSVSNCTGAPAGYVALAGDCNDTNNTIYPTAVEICFNNIDEDCDGLIDENCVCSNPPTAFAGSNLNACEGQGVTLNGSIGGGATTATWSTSGSGTFSPNANTLNATYTPSLADATTGSVTLTLTTDAPVPCTPATSSITVNVTPLPINAGAVSGLADVCAPGSNLFEYSIAPVAGTPSYTWTVSAGIQLIGNTTGTSIGVKFIDAYVQNGLSGQICVKANNSNVCASAVQSCMNVSAQVSTPANPSSISGPQTACPGDIATYTISTVSRASGYNWSLPSGTTVLSGANSNIITVQYPQNFTGATITVSGANACGFGNTRSRNVSMNTLSAPRRIDGPVDGLCGATNAVFSVPAVSGATSYTWTLPAGATITGSSTGSSIMVNFTGASVSSGNITAAAVNNCGTGNARSISVKLAPTTPGSISGASTVCTGSTENYSVSTVQGASSYTWTVPGGATIISGAGTKAITVVHSSTPSANGIVTVRASNNCGLSTVRVKSVNNIACPRNGQTGTISMVAYPNPTHDILNVEFAIDNDEVTIVKMIDASGRLIHTETINAISGANRTSIQVSDFAKGVYLLQLESNNKLEKLRVIVE